MRQGGFTGTCRLAGDVDGISGPCTGYRLQDCGCSGYAVVGGSAVDVRAVGGGLLGGPLGPTAETERPPCPCHSRRAPRAMSNARTCVHVRASAPHPCSHAAGACLHTASATRARSRRVSVQRLPAPLTTRYTTGRPPCPCHSRRAPRAMSNARTCVHVRASAPHPCSHAAGACLHTASATRARSRRVSVQRLPAPLTTRYTTCALCKCA
jgi:hypothetical protein